jgi:hypothetical protein
MCFIAPETVGTYSDSFQMANASAVSFGPQVGVQIVVQQAGPIGQYDRAKAVSYANNYAAYVCSDGYFWTDSSYYGYYGTGVFTPVPTSPIGDDCAHFVSCCIGSEPHQMGGGLNIATRDVTYGEPGAARLVQTNLLAGGLAVEVSSLSSLSPGDVIGWNWEGETNLADLDHDTIYLGNGHLAAHSASCLDVSATTWYQGGEPYWEWHLIHILDAVTTNAPQIATQPVNLAVLPGASAGFTVAAASASPVGYQWLFNGSALAGDTSTILTLPPVTTNDSGVYSVVVTNAYGAVTSAVATLTVNLPLYATNLVVVRVGNGTEPLSGATGNSVYLDQYTCSGAYVSTIKIPDETPGSATNGSSTSPFGSPALLLPGAANDSAYAGALTLSGNGQYLNLAAYCEAYPFSGADVTIGATGGACWRGLYAINASGYSALAYTNTGLFSGGNHTIRAAVSSDGLTNFWTTGQAGSVSGIKYVNATNTVYNNGSGIPSIAGSTTGARVAQIIAGNLVFSDWASASGAGLYACSGEPTPAANANTTPSSQMLATGSGSQPNDFAASPDRATIYIADDRAFVNGSTAAGGIQRWDTTTPPTGYAFSYTLPPTAGTTGAFGLVVDFGAHTAWGPGVKGAVVYATTAGASSNSLIQLVDGGAASIPITLATASTNEALRGLRFGPAVLVSIATQPKSQINCVGSTVAFSVVAAGSAPFSYQWLLNGTNLTDNGRISGSASNVLTLAQVLMSDANNYQVIVTNTCSSATSAVARLSVLEATTVLTWISPAAITYGTALSSDQLNASATAGADSVPGDFGYGPANGAVLSAGTNTLTVLFTPTDTTSYTVATTNVTLVVLPVPPTVTAGDATRPYGQTNPLFTGTIIGLTNDDNITTIYSCTATASSPPGAYSIVPSLADPNHRLGNYTVSTNKGTLTVLSMSAPPAPALQAFTPDGTTLSLSWSTTAGTNYQLQYKTDLAQTNWSNFGSPITAVGDTVTTTDSMTNSARFYRVLLLP